MTPFLSREMLTVRRFQQGDIDAIRRLAALDSQELPRGAVLVAEVGDELVAALPLDGGKVLADPFRPTASIVELLRLRASQLKDETRSPVRSWLGALSSPAWRHHAA